MKTLFLCFAILIASVSVQAQSSLLAFDGIGSYVDLGGQSCNTARTIEMWFKPNVTIDPSSISTGSTLIARNDASQTHEFGLHFRGADWPDGRGFLHFFVRENGILHEIRSNDSTWNAGQWYHVAGVVDSASGMKLYINGMPQTMTDPTGTMPVGSSTEDVSLGRWGDMAIRHFDGQMDEVRIWSAARSQQDIYTTLCGVTAPQPGLQAYYKLDEGSGTVANDATNNFSSALVFATWIADSACSNGTYVGNTGPGWVDLPSGTGDSLRTISFWFKPEASIDSLTSSPGMAFIARNDAEFNEFAVYIRGTDWPMQSERGYLYFYTRNNTVQYSIRSNSNTWQGGQWYQVTCVIDPVTGMRMYIDGMAQNDVLPSAVSATATASEVTAIGRWGDVSIRYFEGQIEDMRLWTRAINSTEINLDTCSSAISNSTGLVADYRFNEGGGMYVLDASGNYRTGMAMNLAWNPDFECEPVSIQAAATSRMMAYPNPTTGMVHLQTPEPITSAWARNASGQALELQIGVDHTIDLSALANGIYLIQARTEGGLFHAKVVLLR